jgi:hypothetical protein
MSNGSSFLGLLKLSFGKKEKGVIHEKRNFGKICNRDFSGDRIFGCCICTGNGNARSGFATGERTQFSG